MCHFKWQYTKFRYYNHSQYEGGVGVDLQSKKKVRIGSKQLIREINQALIVSMVRSSGTISRSAIAKATGLSRAAVSGITAGLIEQGLLYEDAIGESAGGRRPVMLKFVPAAGFVLGVSVSQDEISTVLCDLEATIAETRCEPLRDLGVDAVAAAISRSSAELRLLAGTRPVYGIGVSLEASVVELAQPIVELLSAELGIPAIVDSQVNSLVALAHVRESNRADSSMVLFNLGASVGVGMLVNGEIYRPSPSETYRPTNIYFDRSELSDISNFLSPLMPELVVISGEDEDRAESVRDTLNSFLQGKYLAGAGRKANVSVLVREENTLSLGAATLILGELYRPATRPLGANLTLFS